MPGGLPVGCFFAKNSICKGISLKIYFYNQQTATGLCFPTSRTGKASEPACQCLKYRVERIGSYRVLRGGSWNNNPRNCRVPYRNNDTPDNRNNNTGFRLANTGKTALNRHLYGHGGRGCFCPAFLPAPRLGRTNISTIGAAGSRSSTSRSPHRF